MCLILGWCNLMAEEEEEEEENRLCTPGKEHRYANMTESSRIQEWCSFLLVKVQPVWLGQVLMVMGCKSSVLVCE